MSKAVAARHTHRRTLPRHRPPRPRRHGRGLPRHTTSLSARSVALKFLPEDAARNERLPWSRASHYRSPRRPPGLPPQRLPRLRHRRGRRPALPLQVEYVEDGEDLRSHSCRRIGRLPADRRPTEDRPQTLRRPLRRPPRSAAVASTATSSPPTSCSTSAGADRHHGLPASPPSPPRMTAAPESPQRHPRLHGARPAPPDDAATTRSDLSSPSASSLHRTLHRHAARTKARCLAELSMRLAGKPARPSQRHRPSVTERRSLPSKTPSSAAALAAGPAAERPATALASSPQPSPEATWIAAALAAGETPSPN
jgi:hypothetical protein